MFSMAMKVASEEENMDINYDDEEQQNYQIIDSSLPINQTVMKDQSLDKSKVVKVKRKKMQQQKKNPKHLTESNDASSSFNHDESVQESLNVQQEQFRNLYLREQRKSSFEKHIQDLPSPIRPKQKSDTSSSSESDLSLDLDNYIKEHKNRMDRRQI